MSIKVSFTIMMRKFMRFLYLISFVVPTKTPISNNLLSSIYVQFLKKFQKFLINRPFAHLQCLPSTITADSICKVLASL